MKNRPTSYTISYEDEKSEKIFFLKEHALIGISPFNSYFTEERMEKLFFWALNSFKKITVFIPDEISKYTLQAVGYLEDKAKKKTKRQDSYLKHKAIRALVANKLSETEAEDKIVSLSELVNNEKYAKFKNNYLELYKNDESFRKGCLATSKWVLENKDIFETISDESVNIAVQYFLAELPLYLNTPDILSIPSSLFVYKDPPSTFLKKIYEDNVLASYQQGYLTAKIDNIANEIYINNILKHAPGSVYWKDIDGVYLGCNQMEADMVGLKVPELIIGKTDYDLSWGEIADVLRKTDQRIMQTGIPEEVIETPTLADGTKIIMLTKKSPLYNDEGKVVGIIGTSLDITDRKKVEELEIRKNISEQMAHDIQSPLATLSMFAKRCACIPEKEHIILRNIITSIRSIAHNLLNGYGQESNIQTEDAYVLFPFCISEVLNDKKYQYRDLKNVRFDYSYTMASSFVFIKGNYSDFCRMISNLLNNAVEAFKNNSEFIAIKFIEEDQKNKIIIKDNGAGMPKEVVTKLMENKQVGYSTKEGGHGIGMQQIRDTILKMNGHMSIDSTENVGTEITLTFPKSGYPEWFTDKIVLHKGDTVVVLDDDSSIHSVWKNHLKDYSSDIMVKYFTQSSETISFINSSEKKNKIFLLTDYELRNQGINGVDVIEKCNMQKRSIIVTSVYIYQIKDFLKKFKVIKLLPKAYIDRISIAIEEQPKNVDLVIIDNDASFLEALSTFKKNELLMDTYTSSTDFLNNINKYSKDTKIITDYELTDGMNGFVLANQLHEKGYTNLYLLSGRSFRGGEIPSYLTVIFKGNEDFMEKLL